MKKITNKLVDASFIIRTLTEQIYSGKVEAKDVEKVREKVNSILKEVEVMVKE